MLSEAERENTKLVLTELFGLCDKRSSSYGNILFCSAMTRAFDGNWRNVTSFFLLVPHPCDRPRFRFALPRLCHRFSHSAAR